MADESKVDAAAAVQPLLQTQSRKDASVRYMTLLRTVYIINICGAGFVGTLAFFSPRGLAFEHVFGGAFAQSDAFALVGALWLGVVFLSIIGLFRPVLVSPIMLLQLFYKAIWLLATFARAFLSKDWSGVPKQLSLIFLAYVLGLPLAIPWRHIFAGEDVQLKGK